MPCDEMFVYFVRFFIVKRKFFSYNIGMNPQGNERSDCHD